MCQLEASLKCYHPLYHGEGPKWKSHSGLLLGSSDLNINQMYIRLLKIPNPRTVRSPVKKKNDKGVCVISYDGTYIQLELEMIPKIILKGL